MRIRENKFGEYNINGVATIITNPAKDINYKRAISVALSSIPKRFYNNLDSIYVGIFDFLEERGLNAMYKDKSIFIYSEQESENDIVNDVIHEMAHLVEEDHAVEIYSDGNLEREFLGKRERLFYILKNENFSIPYSKLMKTEYDDDLDIFLYKEIGYDRLRFYTSGLFVSPYSATSLREYFAEGFEAMYYTRDIEELKKLSPYLYYVIINIGEQNE